ncbi:MAG TPA: NUDIX hydrolase [Caulobacteraceae bacterium]|nr:NUDIX hydrolase [Caulobacteraceae bacterium]
MKAAKLVGIQYAALPYRIEGRRVRVLLITSRGSRRWVIPKGWPIGGLTPQDGAATEAAEEAGVAGRIEAEPVGSYRYLKHTKDEQSRAVQVIVFPFRVEGESATWKEAGQRRVRWFSYHEAAAAVAEPSLKRLIRQFGEARTPTLVAQSLHRFRAWRLARAH